MEVPRGSQGEEVTKDKVRDLQGPEHWSKRNATAIEENIGARRAKKDQRADAKLQGIKP